MVLDELTRAAFVLWLVSAALFVLAGRCFYSRKMKFLLPLTPCFVITGGCAAFATFRALGMPALMWPAMCVDLYIAVVSVLFAADMKLGLWAFDMTYAMITCWLAAPLLLLITGAGNAALLARVL